MDELVQAGIKIVVDVTAGHVAAELLDPVLKPVWAVLKSFLPRFDEAGEAIRLNLSEARERYNARGREDAERLKQTIERGEAEALVKRLWFDASRATTAAKMEMLAAAVAGLLTPEFDSEMRSRVTRAIEELEPSDVIALREVRRLRDSGNGVEYLPGTAQNGVALLQTGCLDEARGIGYRTKYDLTPLGRALLQALETWKSGP